MTTTTHLGLTLIEQSQAQKEITANMAFTRIDALMNTGVTDKDIATPPMLPNSGDVYIIAASATGDWAGKSGQIGYFEQNWKFITPNEGLTLWVNDEDCLYTYNSSAWVKTGKGRRSIYIPANAIRPSNTSGCASLAITAMGSNQPDIATLDFDASTEEYAQFSLAMPKAWDKGIVNVAFDWSRGSGTGSYAAVWAMQVVALNDGSAIGASFGSTQTVTDTADSADTLYKSVETAGITPAGTPQDKATLTFRLYRKSADAADTLNIDARLHGVTLFYNTVSGDDA